jgi:phage terminase small subunit
MRRAPSKTAKASKKSDKANSNGLTPKQEKFVKVYVASHNASEAYRKAYDCSKIKPTSIEQSASRLLKNVKVSSRIAELSSKVQQIAEERYLVTQERIIAELATIGFANAEDYFEWSDKGVKIKDSASLTKAQRSVVAEISQTKTKDGGTIKIKLSDKQSALEKLGRHLGMFKDKTDVNINVSWETLVLASFQVEGQAPLVIEG